MSQMLKALSLLRECSSLCSTQEARKQQDSCYGDDCIEILASSQQFPLVCRAHLIGQTTCPYFALGFVSACLPFPILSIYFRLLTQDCLKTIP